MRTGLAAWPGRRSTVSAARSPPRARPRASREDHDLRRRSPARVPAGCRRSPGEVCSRTTNRQIPWQAETLARPEYSSRSGRSGHVLTSARSGRRPAVGSACSPPGSARRGTATSATRPPPISTAALRASPKPGCRSCSVRRNAGRAPSLRSVGGLRPIRARTRSLRACFRWSGPHTATLSGAVSAGSNPAGALLRGINSNTLTILVRQEPGPVTCGNADAFRTLPPARPREAGPQPQKPSSAAKPNDGRQAVALPAGRCSSANIRSYTTAAGTAGNIRVLLSPPGRR
jgi:hypothetical protein